MKETVISPSTGKSYNAMIQDFNKSETHSYMGIITWNSPTSRQTPLQNMIIDVHSTNSHMQSSPLLSPNSCIFGEIKFLNLVELVSKYRSSSALATLTHVC
jgi:hypothetical protein